MHDSVDIIVQSLLGVCIEFNMKKKILVFCLKSDTLKQLIIKMHPYLYMQRNS